MKRFIIVSIILGMLLNIWMPVCAAGEIKREFIIPPLAGDRVEELLDNPDRGFRLENNMNAATGDLAYSETPGDAAIGYLYDAFYNYYTGDDEKPQLVQTYFYLTDYLDRDLEQDDPAFTHMRDYLDYVTRMNKKVLLLFAYNLDKEIDEDGNLIESKYPEVEQIIQHMDAIGASGILEDYKDQLHSVQAGFLGAWGEWNYEERELFKHYKSTVYTEKDGTQIPAEAAMLKHWLAAVPEDLTVQVRWVDIKYMEYENGEPVFNEAERRRIGYHDDNILNDETDFNSAHAIPYYSAELRRDSANVLVDTEMIWGNELNNYQEKGRLEEDYIDDRPSVKYLKEIHATSFSLSHNYREPDTEGWGKPFSLMVWKQRAFDESEFQRVDDDGVQFLYHESYFKDSGGNSMRRNYYEFLRDHLGYYLCAEGGETVQRGDELSVRLTLKNYGFAAPIGLQGIKMVLLDEDGNSVGEKDVDLSSLQPGAEVIVEGEFGNLDADGKYKAAVMGWSSNGATVRFANDVTYENGLNILFEVDMNNDLQPATPVYGV